jgi:hypothetical protein
MQQIRIHIDVENSAFEDADGSEVVRILRELADQYESDGLYSFETLRDVNGNRVGKAELHDSP